ncbi:hypothetical protein TNCV_3900881 [Trichonephila clavipes]|nr:hypothetical protein TNCV_3900881 [Trichonephila clavipes]
MGKEASVLVKKPIFNSSFNLITIGKTPSLQSFLEWTEDVVFTQREVRAELGMYENLPVEPLPTITLFNTPLPREDVHYNAIDNPARQHAESLMFDVLFLFKQCGILRCSNDGRTVWRHPEC